MPKILARTKHASFPNTFVSCREYLTSSCIPHVFMRQKFTSVKKIIILIPECFNVFWKMLALLFSRIDNQLVNETWDALPHPCALSVIMKQIKFRSRMERVLRTMYIVMYAFRSNTELAPVFQSTGTLVPFEIPAESGRNVPPCLHGEVHQPASLHCVEAYDACVLRRKASLEPHD